MCTLILGRDALGEGTIVIAANRDENPARPSEPPRTLRERPRIAGGRDALAGGTWLAIRGGAAPGVAALLNRRPAAEAPPARRSRGLLALDVAAADDPLAAARAAIESGDYAPCTLLWASPGDCWAAIVPAGGAPRIERVPAGWHAIAHAELDDPGEPRTAWLAHELRAFAPDSPDEAFARTTAWLAQHAGSAGPAVCIHDGRMPTVSAARVFLSPRERRYEHAEGRPCVTAFADFTHLIADEPSAGGMR